MQKHRYIVTQRENGLFRLEAVSAMLDTHLMILELFAKVSIQILLKILLDY